MDEKVSIIMPTYNRDYIISNAIDSIIEQSYKEWELIIVDDGSIDNTANLVATYQKKFDNIFFYKNRDNKGACVRRNEGINYSTGAYIAFIDSDNCWHPEKLKRQVTLLKKNKCDFCFCNVKIMDGASPYIVPKNFIEKDLLCKILLKENIIDTNSLLISKDKIIKAGLFDEDMPRLQDYELLFRLVYYQNASFCHLNEVLVTNYLQKNSITFNNNSYARALSIFINKHEQFFAEEDRAEWVANILISNGWNTNEGRQVLKRTLKDSEFCCEVSNKVEDIILATNYEMRFLNNWTDADWKNIEKALENKKVAIYGVGKYGKRLIKKFKELNIDIVCVIDREGGNYFEGYLIKCPDEVDELIDIIILSMLYPNEILKKQLSSQYNAVVIELVELIMNPNK